MPSGNNNSAKRRNDPRCLQYMCGKLWRHADKSRGKCQWLRPIDPNSIYNHFREHFERSNNNIVVVCYADLKLLKYGNSNAKWPCSLHCGLPQLIRI